MALLNECRSDSDNSRGELRFLRANAFLNLLPVCLRINCRGGDGLANDKRIVSVPLVA